MHLLKPQDYQPSLALRFAFVRDRMQAHIAHCLVEHIGSSSIPGSLSKGDLDICVLVPLADHLATVELLTGLGYVEKTETLRTDELCMLEWHEPGAEHAIQLVAQGSEFEMFITFRDLLRANPALVAEYNYIKSTASHLSIYEYRAAKSAFIERVLHEHEPTK